jgi:hypothetical protein
METVTVIQIIICGAILAAAVYCYADARAQRELARLLALQLDAQRKELREWQNKTLTRHGVGSLDPKPFKASKAKQQDITPKVVTRQQMEYRQNPDAAPHVSIHAHDVSYQRVARTVEKAAEIIAAHK